MLMGNQMRQPSCKGGDRHEDEEPDRAEATRDRASERQQPQDIETDMAEVSVQQRIGQKGPDLGAGAAGKRRREQRRVVAPRNEAEYLDGPVFQIRRQQHAQMNDGKQEDIGSQGAGQRQDRFTTRCMARCTASGAETKLRPSVKASPIQIAKKGRPEKPPLRRCWSFRASIPTPPRATTKPVCSHPAIVFLAGPWRKTFEAMECADTTRYRRIANSIVNLTLKPQNPRPNRPKRPGAKARAKPAFQKKTRG